MFKDLRRTVHLTQDDDHLFVNEALELSQVARHVHLQLGSDLWNTRGRKSAQVSSKTPLPSKLSSLKKVSAFCTHLFTGHILQVFLHHDPPEPGFNLTLRQLSFSGPAKKKQDANIRRFLT